MVFFAGCVDVLSPPEIPATGANVLVVHIGGESLAGRTALPSAPASVTYDISVTGASAGSLAGAAGPGPFLIPLSGVPAQGDVVSVEAFASGVKWAEGSYTLPSGYTPGTSISVTLLPFRAGTGDVSLSVSFAPGSGDDEITAAELSLYKSRADYEAGNVYSFKRYRKYTAGGDYGAGEDLTPSIPIAFTAIPSGNYVVQIEFFRFKYVRVSRLVQTVIVRDGLTTNHWDGGGSGLTWGTDKFASSNANLASSGGIKIDGTTIDSYAPATYIYSLYTSGAPSNKTLTVTAGTPGQAITVSLNGSAGTSLPSGQDITYPMAAANSLAITVTAPDGVTKKTYAVSYTFVRGGEWYVSQGGDDSNTGLSSGNALASVGAALTKISDPSTYDSSWPGKASSNPAAARINISGTITEAVTITDTALYAQYPPILLAGSGTDKIDANNSGRPLSITKATVILGDGLSLTGGNYSGEGGGVYVNGGSFIMNGGSVSGNKASGRGGGLYSIDGEFTLASGTISNNECPADGGGVYIHQTNFNMIGGLIGSNRMTLSYGNGGGIYIHKSNFTFSGGEISDNTSASGGGGIMLENGSSLMMGGNGAISGNTAKFGGGVHVSNSSFTMSGGSVSGNNSGSNGNGGAVYVNSGSSFAMDGGTVAGNTSQNGGGVYVDGGSNFAMSGGTISGNEADGSGSNGNGGGVYINNNTFTMDGGTITGNTANSGGGGVFVSGSGATFTMNGGAVGGNTAGSGGGVRVDGTFNMHNGTIGGNTANGNGSDGGGGVFVNDSGGNFTMDGGTISGNSTAGGNEGGGGGVRVANTGTFDMSGGTISGNSTTGHDGGGVLVRKDNSKFTMSGGTISGNTTNQGGGGVYVSDSSGNGFIMSGGTISGNSSDSGGSGGGGVGLAAGKFTMSGGTISGNSAVNRGGGTLLYQGGNTFAMSGGTISGNTAGSSGSGVCVDGDGGSSTFTMSGDARVDTGNPVYLGSGRVIDLSGILAANPAANIESGGGAGTQVLTGAITTDDNYKKFWLDGVSNADESKIDTDGKIK